MNIKSANGLVGCLIHCGDGQYRIRVYDESKLSMFKDYNIAHCDLFFEIQDEDAFLYESDNGKLWIDHSPATLGIIKDDLGS